MAYISEEELNNIRSNADIVDVISDYLDLKQRGRNYVAVCPFHDDHSPSLVVSRERQMFTCFTCKTSGNVFSFVMKYENVSFPEAVQTVAKKIGYTLKGDFSNFKESKYKKEYEIAIKKFGFKEEDKQKKISEFSGGQRTKIAFIKLLLSKPDILLLDEPTNHLDITTIEWLEEYLKQEISQLRCEQEV